MVFFTLRALPLTDPERSVGEGHPVHDSLIVQRFLLLHPALPWWLVPMPDVMVRFNGPIVLGICGEGGPSMVFDGGGFSPVQCDGEVFRYIVDLSALGSPNVSDLIASPINFLLPCFIVAGDLVARYPFEVYLVATQSVYLFPHSDPNVNERTLNLKAVPFALVVGLDVVEVVSNNGDGW